jgi:DNA-binding NtrC family response regulator
MKRSSEDARKRVLIVEDDADLRTTLVEAIMDQTNYEVTSVDNGRTASELMRTGQFDVVIADARLPQVSGIELLQICRKSKPTLAFILITGLPNFAAGVDWNNLDADAFLSKPFTLKELLRAVEACTSESRKAYKNKRVASR